MSHNNEALHDSRKKVGKVSEVFRLVEHGNNFSNNIQNRSLTSITGTSNLSLFVRPFNVATIKDCTGAKVIVIYVTGGTFLTGVGEVTWKRSSIELNRRSIRFITDTCFDWSFDIIATDGTNVIIRVAIVLSYIS